MQTYEKFAHPGGLLDFQDSGEDLTRGGEYIGGETPVGAMLIALGHLKYSALLHGNTLW